MHIAIIGSGSSAFAAAIYAAEKGAKVTMIEAGVTGGTCVNVGCVPSKIFIRAAQMAHSQQAHSFAGISKQIPTIQRKLMLEQQQIKVDELRNAKYESILTANPNITFVRGVASFKDKNTLGVTNAEGTRFIKADRILIATGSTPIIPDISGLNNTPYWTSTEALQSDTLPQHLVVLGGSVVAVELAQAFLRLGSKVTLLARSGLLSKEDPQIGTELKKIFEKEGMRVLLNTMPQQITHDGEHFIVNIDSESIVADRVLVATGRMANLQKLALENIGIKTDKKGRIFVNEQMRTNIDSIFAAGDCTNQPQYVYVAAAAGTRAAVNMLGGHATLDLNIVPAITFTDPQVATVGLTEMQAQELKLNAESRTLALDNVPRALVNFDTQGFVKLVAEKSTGRILGAQILATEGGEAIQTMTIAIRQGMTINELSSQLFPYLTMVESLKLCAQIFSKDVKKLSCCADSFVMEEPASTVLSNNVKNCCESMRDFKKEEDGHKHISILLDSFKKLSPMEKCQQELNPNALKIHQAILHSFAQRGYPLTRREISELLPNADASAILSVLQQKDLVVLNDKGEPNGAYPFTLNQTPHQLILNGHLVYSMCAFDAVGVSAMFGVEVKIHSHCHVTNTQLYIHILDRRILEVSHPDIQVVLDWQERGDCCEKSICPNLIFLQNRKIAKEWTSKKENTSFIALNEAVELSAAYFSPLVSGTSHSQSIKQGDFNISKVFQSTLEKYLGSNSPSTSSWNKSAIKYGTVAATVGLLFIGYKRFTKGGTPDITLSLPKPGL